MYQVVERNVVVERGPHWWIAYLSHTPTRAYRGRSSAEAIGRLISEDADAIGFGLPIVDKAGFPMQFFHRPLLPLALAQHRRDLDNWRVDPKYIPAAGKAAA